MLRHALRSGIILCLSCILLALCAGNGMASDSKEYQVKAAFIYNFVKFVEWPDGKAISRQSKIDICVAGDSGLMDTSNIFDAASTDRLKLSLVQEDNWKSAASHCHILFIGASEEDHLSEILGALRGQPVLTVSDIDNFIGRGGMIGFVVVDNKIKIAVNMNPVAAAGMRIDAQLLEIALKVIRK